MSVKVYHNTKIYIACPANVATGGPEALHQLGFHLINDLNIPAFIYYYNFDNKKFKDPIHPEYKSYNIPYILEISEKEDSDENFFDDNIIDLPENFVEKLIEYKSLKDAFEKLTNDEEKNVIPLFTRQQNKI